VELYRKVRLARSEGMSQRELARHFNISRDSVRKMLAFSAPPGYRRKKEIKRPKLDGFTEIIDDWLEEDKKVPRKQRHTAKRIHERLRAEHGFTGGYTIIKDYVRQRDRRSREMFVPLSHPPGHAQADFGEAVIVIGGVEQKAHFFVLDLPHSDAYFVRAYPAATAEAWMDGHVHAFAFFGGVPQSVLYDNDRCLVSKIQPDGTRVRATASRTGRASTPISKSSVSLVRTICSGGTRRPSARVCNWIWPRCAPCQPLPLRPAHRPAVG
jgi:transposase